MNSILTSAERRPDADPYVQLTNRGSFGVPFNLNNNSRITASAPGYLKYSPRRSQGIQSFFVTVHLTSPANTRSLGGNPERPQALNNRTDPYSEVGHPIKTYFEVAAEQLEKPLIRAALTENSLEKRHPNVLDDFLQPVVSLEKCGHVDAALDVLYDRIDGLLKIKRFSALDELLQQAKPDQMSVDVILGLLTASLPAKTKLSARPRFFEEAEASLKKRADWEEGLLAGLES